MSHGEVLPDNTDDPKFRPSDRSDKAHAEDAEPQARMATTPGEPGLSKVPSITPAMLRERDEPQPAEPPAPTAHH
jgi:hypothetical protein